MSKPSTLRRSRRAVRRAMNRQSRTDGYTDCVRCEWQLIETVDGVCDTCGFNRYTGDGPSYHGKKGSE